MRTVHGYGALFSVVLAACGGPREVPAVEAHSAGAAGGTQSPSATANSSEDGGTVRGAASSGLAVSAAADEADVDGGRAQRHAHEPGRGREDIRAIVVGHRDEARGCYEKALAAHPGIEGNLVIRWTIDPKGTVTQVINDLTRSQIFEPSLVSCIGDVLTKIQFAPSQRGFETKASYPFNFHPRHTSPTPPSGVQ